MKKLILILFLSVNAYAGVWSSLSQSGFHQAYAELNAFVQSENDYISNFWKQRIKPLIEEISEETKEKEKKLKIIRELEKENLLIENQINFLLNKKKELFSNEANIISNQ